MCKRALRSRINLKYPAWLQCGEAWRHTAKVNGKWAKATSGPRRAFPQNVASKTRIFCQIPSDAPRDCLSSYLPSKMKGTYSELTCQVKGVPSEGPTQISDFTSWKTQNRGASNEGDMLQGASRIESPRIDVLGEASRDTNQLCDLGIIWVRL